MILSNNARPIPTLSVERNYSDASKWPVLRWLGPWRASIGLGALEGGNVALPNVKFLEARFTFKPKKWLEIGLSRTAQFCGKGRVCNVKAFTNTLLGRDNGSTAVSNPGNQMAGYDLRLRSPWKKIPAAVFIQLIGEDEANHLPSKFLGLLGGEVWGNSRFGSWRLRGEYADSACEFSRRNPEFGCAYRNTAFPQGYTFRGRIIGHSMDNDGRMYSLGATLVRPKGDSWNVTLRKVDLNRDGGFDSTHTVSKVASELKNVEVQYNRALAKGQLQLGVGLDDIKGDGTHARGFVGWRVNL